MNQKQIETFWSKVNKSGPILPNMTTNCWVWTASKLPAGYGVAHFRQEKTRLAHRLSWEMAHGPIPDGMCVCHKCDNPPCVRPDHLFLGTTLDNTYDKVLKRRHPHGDSSFARLHPDKLPRGTNHYSKVHPEKVARGEAKSQAKLTLQKVNEIRTRYAAGGVTQQKLATEFGVSFQNIQKVVSGKSWQQPQSGEQR